MKLVLSVLAVISAAPLHPVFAQPYPSKPIELVVHTAPGGGSDLVARTVAEVVARDKLLPQILIVQNRSGGSGAIAQSYVAGKRGDPYTSCCRPPCRSSCRCRSAPAWTWASTSSIRWE